MHTEFSLANLDDLEDLDAGSRRAFTVQWCCDLNSNCPPGWRGFKFKLTQNTVMQCDAVRGVLRVQMDLQQLEQECISRFHLAWGKDQLTLKFL